MHALTVAEQAMGIFAGIGVVLLVATVVGRLLKVSVAQGQPHGVIDNLNARIRSWWVIVAIVAFALMLGREGITLLFAAISFQALREFMGPVSARSGMGLLSSSLFLVLPVQYLLVWLGWFGLYSTFVPVCALILIPLFAASTGRYRAFVGCASTVQWGLMVCVFCVSHAPALLTLDVAGYEGRNVLLIVFLIVVVQSSDVLQYIWGKACGRRKIAPAISPSKTWEGLIGGVASATAIGAALSWITPFTPVEAAFMAVVVIAMGLLGSFAMSAVKRSRRIKDWGSLIDGHGGMLDRIDSMVFAAPVFFYLTRLFWG